LAAENTFVAERILKVNYPFEYVNFSKIVDIIKLLFTIKVIKIVLFLNELLN